jgi:hypothetical protein
MTDRKKPGVAFWAEFASKFAAYTCILAGASAAIVYIHDSLPLTAQTPGARNSCSKIS